MLALIAGTGELPGIIFEAQAKPPLICALRNNPPDRLTADLVFDLERLGGFLKALKARGVTRICLCGAVARPVFNWRRLDLATICLLPRIVSALKRGDDGALRILITLLEKAGFTVLAAHELAPDLLLPEGVPTHTQPSEQTEAEALLGDQISYEQARADLGQACILRGSHVIAREGQGGTDAMLTNLTSGAARGGVFYKAPKPGQDRRADLPVIGPATALACAQAGLRGVIIEAGGVMLLEHQEVIRRLDAEGMFLWIRERP